MNFALYHTLTLGFIEIFLLFVYGFIFCMIKKYDFSPYAIKNVGALDSSWSVN